MSFLCTVFLPSSAGASYIIKVAFAIDVKFLMADNIFDIMNLDFVLPVPLIMLFSNNRAFVATLIFIVCELSHV